LKISEYIIQPEYIEILVRIQCSIFFMAGMLQLMYLVDDDPKNILLVMSYLAAEGFT
jgi:hypothetical protein